jgi:hypothetical protein
VGGLPTPDFLNRPAALDFVTSSWANLHGNIFIIQLSHNGNFDIPAKSCAASTSRSKRGKFRIGLLGANWMGKKL